MDGRELSHGCHNSVVLILCWGTVLILVDYSIQEKGQSILTLLPITNDL